MLSQVAGSRSLPVTAQCCPLWHMSTAHRYDTAGQCSCHWCSHCVSSTLSLWSLKQEVLLCSALQRPQLPPAGRQLWCRAGHWQPAAQWSAKKTAAQQMACSMSQNLANIQLGAACPMPILPATSAAGHCHRHPIAVLSAAIQLFFFPCNVLPGRYSMKCAQLFWVCT